MDETMLGEIKAKIENYGLRIDRMEDRVSSLEQDQSQLSGDVRHIRELCDEMHSDLKNIMAKPAQRWERISSVVLEWAVIAILAASIVFK